MSIDLDLFTSVLYAVVAVMLIVVLYHVLFILWDMRKIVRRFEDMTSQVETVLMKPLSMAEGGIQWLIEFIQHKAKQHKHKGHKGKHHVIDEGEEEASE